MGNGTSVNKVQRKNGVVTIQTVRAGVRFQAGIHCHEQEAGSSSQEERYQEEHPDKEESKEKSNKDPNLLVDGTKISQDKISVSKTSAKKLDKKIQKPVTVSKTSRNTNKSLKLEKSHLRTSKKKTGGKQGKSSIRKFSNAQKEHQPLSQLSQQIASILHGSVDQKCPLNTKLVRIFISSTFTDTEHERNVLMERVYPKLKTYCQENGYEFQVVDMRWGVRDEATDMHETTELCINEIRACQKLSAGPNFITLLAEKYGYCPLPPKIDATDFDALMDAVPEDDTKQLFHKWYRMDQNAIPTSYVLQPVTTWYPEYFSKDDEPKRESSRQQWEEVFLRLKKALVTAVRSVFSDEQKIHLFVRSVSEAEIEEGLLKATVDTAKCGWLHRRFTGLNAREQGIDDNMITKYFDTLTRSDDGVDTKRLLDEFRNRMKQVLEGGNHVVEYKVNWNGKGIDTNSTEHKEYLETFCSDFENMLRTMIGKSIAEYKNSEIDSPLYAEVCQHALFCQAKIEMFHGRKNTLQQLLGYVKNSSRSPLVLYGKSGCGKTSIIAMMAKMVQEVTEENVCVILRFIGTTPKSSSIRRLLKSVLQQIKSVYHLNTKIPRKTKSIVEVFSTILSSATKHKPLVVLFDSLDQLSRPGGARQLSWLPKSLPEHVKFIVSTLPDNEFRCFPKLKATLKDPKLFIEVPDLPEQDVRDILTKWLKSKNRTLQPEQLISIETAFRSCPLPLFLKISFDEACHWRSYMPPDQTRLQITIRDAINNLFERIERKHGELLVRHALGYLTAARSGLTANELEDILSCDDEVLNDVFQYWTPPIRRLPPLLWVRIRADLESYLVLRGAEGASVTYWYHRQFIKAAKTRYLLDDQQRIKIHSHIADYFMGYDPYDRAEERARFARLTSVSSQPLKLSRHCYNLRKLHELPYHLTICQRWEHLKNEVLCNYVWLEAKIRARTLRDVLDDFRHVQEYHKDPDIVTIGEILELGKDAILADPSQLASQLVSRIYDKKVQDTSSLIASKLSLTLISLLKDAHHSEEPSLLPNRAFLDPPGGQLVKTLVGHKKGVYGLAATQDGKYLVTGSQDGSVKIWCISNGYLMTSVEDVGEEIDAIKCCDDDKRIVVSSKRGLTVLDFDTGEILQSYKTRFFDYPPPFTLAGKKEKIVVFFEEKGLKSIDSMTRQVYFHMKDLLPVGSSGQNSLLTSYGSTLLCNSKEDENSLNVIDVHQGSVTHSFVVFDSKDDEAFLNLTEIAMRREDEVIVAKKLMVDLYDVQSGSKLKSIRCKLDDWISHVSVIVESDLLVFPKRNKVAILDLNTNERRDVLEHSNYISRSLATAGGIVVTSGGDSVVRVWDLTREDIHHQVEKPETVLHIYPLPTDPRHIITVGRLGLNVHVITTWDLSTFLPVRRVSNISSSYLKVINDRRAALRVDNNAVILDMNSWKVVCVLKGKIPDFIYAGTPDLCVVNESSEILTYAFDQKSLKIYSIETGEETGMLLGPRQQYKIQAYIVNSEGTLLAHNDEPLEVIFIWDVIKRELLFSINRCGYTRFVLTLAAFTPVGTNFVLSIRRTDENDYIRHPSVWDVKNKRVVHDLRYPEDTDTRSLAVIDQGSAVTSHQDYNIVVWDLNTGTARYVLHSLHYGSRVDVLSSGGRYIVSHDDKNIILWDVQEGKQVGSFTADKHPSSNWIQCMKRSTYKVKSHSKKQKLCPKHNYIFASGYLLLSSTGCVNWVLGIM